MSAKIGWANRVLGAFRALEVEEVGRQLEEQKRLEAERLGLPRELLEWKRRMAPEDMGEGRLREAAARLRRAVEAVDVAPDPLAACHYLRRLQGPLSRIDAASLFSAEDARYHADMLRIWESRREQAFAHWGDDGWAAAAGLLGAADGALAAVERMLALTEGPPSGSARPFTCEIAALAECAERVQRLAGSVPGARLESLPVWATLERAATGLVRPHKANLFLYRCGVLLATADGDLSTLERDCLHAMAEAIRLTPSEARDLISGAALPDLADLRGALLDLCRDALNDGVATEVIARAVRIAGDGLGISEGEAPDFLARLGVAPGPPAPPAGRFGELCFLDTEGVRSFLRSYVQIPAMTWLASDVPLEVLGRVGNALGLDTAEEPLLIYEFRYLGATGECGALTRLRLLWKPSPAEPVRLGVGELVRHARDVLGSSSPLQLGRVVRPSASATAFLTLVLACAKRNLVRIRPA